MNELTFNEYLTGAEAYYQEHKQHLRRGQAYMNYLGEVSMSFYHAVPRDVDPFYDDKYIPSFLDWLVE